MLFLVLVSYLNPLVNLMQAWQGSKSSESQLAQLKQERVDLTRQLHERSSARRAAWEWSSLASTPTSSTASATTERPLRSLPFSPRI